MRLHRRELPMKELPSGHLLTTPHLIVEGDRAGKKVYIQAGSHGGELAGHGAIWELLGILAKETEVAGEIHLLPQVNPVSFNQKVGDWQVGVYDLHTGSNWNRIFKLLVAPDGSDAQDPRIDLEAFADRHRETPWSELRAAFQDALRGAVSGLRDDLGLRGLDYRDRHALTLQEISCDADLVLDLHTGDCAPRYLYVPPWCPEAMYAFDISYHLVLNDRFAGAMDEATICPWLMLAEALDRRGRRVELDVEAYTVELGSLETLDAEAMRADAKRLARFLRAQGVLSGDAEPDPAIPRHRCAIEDYVTYSAPASGLALFEKAPGSAVHRGEVVARILAPGRIDGFDLGGAETPVLAQDDGFLITRPRSPVVYRGQSLFRMMTRVEKR